MRPCKKGCPGSVCRYAFGGRCDKCKAAHAARQKQWRRENKERQATRGGK